MNTHLSVNLNKVALVRNTRHLGIPSVTRAATLCLQAGAHGITVHPRPDQRHIRECPLYLVWLADLARLEAVGERRNRPRDGLDYLELLLVGAMDAALASQNAAVAAEAQGLGVVYIGGMRDRPEEVAAELGLPPRTVAVFGMCVGYPDPARPTSIKPRLPIDAVLHRERYDTAAQGEPVDRYVATMADFYKSQQMKTNGDWAEHSLHRVRGPEAMRGRDRLGEALKARGFLAR
jgi:nitroreductase